MSKGTDAMQGFAGRSTAPKDPVASLILLYAPPPSPSPAPGTGSGGDDDGARIPRAFTLDNGTIIGREPPPGGLCIPQSAVSRIHARVERRTAGWRITDLESRNGVLVNGRFAKEKMLAHRDELRIGDAIFEFRLDVATASTDASPSVVAPELVGGWRIRTIASELDRIARTAVSVLILGETGTGKEVAARALHRLSQRTGPFVALNCAAIPANLVESELFGFRRGAFTGADRDHPGLVRSANNGTLLLDEIGDMPVDAQAKLLRLLETREVVSLGSSTGTHVDVRIVCATHRHLATLAEDGRFRGDLFARIQGYTVTLPPLRERKEDVPLLVRHLLAKEGRASTEVGLQFMIALLRYHWPYNVRELAQAIQRVLAMSASATTLSEEHLPEVVRAAMAGYGDEDGAAVVAAPPPSVDATSAAATVSGTPTEAELRGALSEVDGNVAAVARRYGKDPAQIRRWMRLFSISADAYRSS